jgi:hypothetical protein
MGHIGHAEGMHEAVKRGLIVSLRSQAAFSDHGLAR